MFKKDLKAEFKQEAHWFSWRYYFQSGKTRTTRAWAKEDHEQLLRKQKDTPVIVMKNDPKKEKWWIFCDVFYYENEGYSESEVKALALADSIRRERRISKAVSTVEQKERLKIFNREPIPESVQQFVWKRDEGKCVKCGSNEKLEFDHIYTVL